MPTFSATKVQIYIAMLIIFSIHGAVVSHAQSPDLNIKSPTLSHNSQDNEPKTPSIHSPSFLLNQLYSAQDYFQFKLSEWERKKQLEELETNATEGGIPEKWHLASAYLKIKNSKKYQLKALKIFEELSNNHADINPNDQNSPYISNAFVNVGVLYLSGINGGDKIQNSKYARRLFEHASFYFGDTMAQFQLAKLLLADATQTHDRAQALRLLKHSARRNNAEAQALLGKELFEKSATSKRRRAAGLYWIMRAKENAQANQTWIITTHDHIVQQATSEDMEMVERYAEHKRSKNSEEDYKKE